MSPGTFDVISRSRPDSLGGGAGGGGGGGGVVAEFFPLAPGKQQSDYLNSGNFF